MIFYSIFYNFSLADNGFLKSFAYPIPTDTKILKLKQDIDNGILKILGKRKGLNNENIPYVNASYSSYPLPPDRMTKDQNQIVIFGLFFMTLGPLFTF